MCSHIDCHGREIERGFKLKSSESENEGEMNVTSVKVKLQMNWLRTDCDNKSKLLKLVQTKETINLT